MAFDAHPTTGVVFDGFQIPCFQEAKELVLKAALESDKILVVGWDVAISENGPVVIEGNRRPGFDLVQVLDDLSRRQEELAVRLAQQESKLADTVSALDEELANQLYTFDQMRDLYEK